MKKMIVSVAMMMAVFGLHAQAGKKTGKVVIEGTMTGDLKGHNLMYTYNRMGQDSAVIKDGHYRFEFPFNGIVQKMLLPEYITKEGQMYRPFGILIDGPGTYYITSDISKGMHESILKGQEGMMLFSNYENEQDAANLKINKVLGERFGQDWWQMEEKDPRYAKKQELNDSLQEAFVLPLLETLLREHPDANASVYVLSVNARGINSVDRQLQLYNMLSEGMKKSDEGMKFYNFIQGEKNSGIGKMVANFILPDPQDKPVSFDQFKGKYVMIDFWASWCVPCRASFPTMRKIYHQYKNKGFEIYSISIDENKKSWLKAVKEENNPWSQALDTKDINHIGFAVTGVPTTYLIDPQGRIVAKQVGFDEGSKGPVEEKLASMFGELSNALTPGAGKPGEKNVIPAATMVPMVPMQ
ncbi:TlpA family protein disulfide reductase [Flavitalea flava]